MRARVGRIVVVLGAVLAAVGLIVPFGAHGAGAQDTNLVVTDLAGGVTKEQLANALVGAGVSVSNVTYDGADVSAGSFTGGSAIGFNSGIVLSSGRVRSTGDGCEEQTGVEGPNGCDDASTITSSGGDADLDDLTTGATEDATILELDFVPSFGTVSFDYVFASEEYNEFVNDDFNDVFGFFVNGTNCATVGDPAVPVTVNSVNGGNPLGTDATNASLYRNNEMPGATINTEMDGLTVVLHCNATVNAGQTNHLKLAIADVTDAVYDSAVFLGASTLVSGVQISDTLTSGSTTGQDITVASGSAVTDTATLQGGSASSATGTVTYTVYTDSACTNQVANAGTKTVGANGVVPASDAVTLTDNGTYYWKSVYSGDGSHNAATSPCTAKATVNDGPTTTSTSTSTSTTAFVGSPPTTSRSDFLGAGSGLADSGAESGIPLRMGLLLVGLGLVLLGEGMRGEEGRLVAALQWVRTRNR